MSPELAGLFYASFLLFELGSSWMCSFVVDPVVITLGPWGCHLLVYVANVFCLEAVMLFSFF